MTSRTYLPGASPPGGGSGQAAAAVQPDARLDITGEVCPMTFVRTRLALDRLSPGQTLLVTLRGEEPLRNVPRTAEAQGHAVLALETGADGIGRLLLRRGP
ncbi:MAG: sulfurtransferase TusA family protein [Proteobacteria bacterium]|nr:sulfurtransferase TusA family protein [Pseudomonadota bacterium]